jgi:hypothetical protein
MGFPSLAGHCGASVMIPGSKDNPAFMKAGIRFSDAVGEGGKDALFVFLRLRDGA